MAPSRTDDDNLKESQFPKPDRSNAERIADETEIGWYEGILSDGRPYRAECWAVDQLTMLTFFMSTRSLEDSTSESFATLLEEEGLVRFVSKHKYLSVASLVDGNSNEMWSVNVVLGDEDETFVEDLIPLRAHRRRHTGGA